MAMYYVLDRDNFDHEDFYECAEKFEASDEDSAAKAWASKAFDEAGEGDTDGMKATCLVSKDPSGNNAVRIVVRLSVTVKYEYEVSHK